MKMKSVKKWTCILGALGIALTSGAFQAAPWVWREIPTMRGMILPIIVQNSKSWHGAGGEQIVQKLGMPISKEGSITIIFSDKGKNLYYIPIGLQQSFSEKDPNRFAELVNIYCGETLSVDQRIAILGSLGKIGNIHDFRNHFQKLRSAHELLILEEQWIYEVGNGKFDRAIRLIFDDSRKLKSLETFWKDGK